MGKHIYITRVRDYTAQHDYASYGTVRLQSTVVCKLGGRSKWVRISNGKKSIYRIMRAITGNSPSGFTAECAELDADSRFDLGVNEKIDEMYKCSLSIFPANGIGILVGHWSHPQEAIRLANRLGFMGLILGILSFIPAIKECCQALVPILR